jgi:hypothetical protein
MVHYIRSGESNANEAEIEAAEDRVSFLQYDGFYDWLWSYSKPS